MQQTTDKNPRDLGNNIALQNWPGFRVLVEDQQSRQYFWRKSWPGKEALRLDRWLAAVNRRVSRRREEDEDCSAQSTQKGNSSKIADSLGKVLACNHYSAGVCQAYQRHSLAKGRDATERSWEGSASQRREYQSHKRVHWARFPRTWKHYTVRSLGQGLSRSENWNWSLPKAWGGEPLSGEDDRGA